jgi:hypothetical protein
MVAILAQRIEVRHKSKTQETRIRRTRRDRHVRDANGPSKEAKTEAAETQGVIQDLKIEGKIKGEI